MVSISRIFPKKLNMQEKIKIGYRPLYRILTSARFVSPKAQKKKKKDNAHPLRDRTQYVNGSIWIPHLI